MKGKKYEMRWRNPKRHLFQERFVFYDSLAGVECKDDSEAPIGWTKWVISGYEYIYVERENEDTFSEVIKHLEEHDISLAGAVHDFTCPQTGKGYLFFPIRRL